MNVYTQQENIQLREQLHGDLLSPVSGGSSIPSVRKKLGHVVTVRTNQKGIAPLHSILTSVIRFCHFYCFTSANNGYLMEWMLTPCTQIWWESSKQKPSWENGSADSKWHHLNSAPFPPHFIPTSMSDSDSLTGSVVLCFFFFFKWCGSIQ